MATWGIEKWWCAHVVLKGAHAVELVAVQETTLLQEVARGGRGSGGMGESVLAASTPAADRQLEEAFGPSVGRCTLE